MKHSRFLDNEDDQLGDHADNLHVNKKKVITPKGSKLNKCSRPSTKVDIANDDEACTCRKQTTTTNSPPSTTKTLKHPRSDSGNATEKTEEPSKIQPRSSRKPGRHNLEIINKSGFDTNASDEDKDDEYEEHSFDAKDD